MQLVIKAHAGDTEEKTITLDVQSTDTVDSVKQKIQKLEGDTESIRHPLGLCHDLSAEHLKHCGKQLHPRAGHPASQQLLVLGLRLEDNQTLADYHILEDTVLHMRMVRLAIRCTACLFTRKQSLMHPSCRYRDQCNPAPHRHAADLAAAPTPLLLSKYCVMGKVTNSMYAIASA